MLRKVLAHLRAQWMGALALFLVVAGGTAYAANTVFSSDIVNGEVKSVDIGNSEVNAADLASGSVNGGKLKNDSTASRHVVNNSLKSDDIADGQLKDEDVGQAAIANFAVNVGSIAADDCDDHTASGPPLQGDHLLLTPSREDADPALNYTAEYHPASEELSIIVCNSSNATIDDGFTHFNLITFDAQ